MSTFWTLLEQGWRRSWWQLELRAPVELSPSAHQHPTFTDQKTFLSPINSVRALKRESITFYGLADLEFTCGSTTILVLTVKGSWMYLSGEFFFVSPAMPGPRVCALCIICGAHKHKQTDNELLYCVSAISVPMWKVTYIFIYLL